MFNVKNIFQTHYPDAFKAHPRIANAGAALLAIIWQQKRFSSFAKKYASLGRIDLMAAMLRDLNIRIDITAQELEKIPRSGGLIIACNHSMGIADGLGLITTIYSIRPDVKLVQGGVLRDVFAFGEHSMAVDNISGGIDRKVYKEARDHLKNGGVLLMFPAGQVARKEQGIIQEREWTAGFYRFSKSAKAPILPVYIRGKNSRWFYFLGQYFKPLSMLWVMPEFFKHANKSFPMRVGDVVPYAEIEVLAAQDEPAFIASMRQKSLALDAQC